MLTAKGMSGQMAEPLVGWGLTRDAYVGNGLEVEVDIEKHTHPTFHFVEGKGCVLMGVGEGRKGETEGDVRP